MIVKVKEKKKNKTLILRKNRVEEMIILLSYQCSEKKEENDFLLF